MNLFMQGYTYQCKLFCKVALKWKLTIENERKE